MFREKIFSINKIPFYESFYGEAENLPEKDDNNVYIVSKMVVDAFPERDDIYYPGELLRDDKGNIIGSIGLTR